MVTSAAAPVARAQSADDKIAAEALFDQGKKLLGEGKFAEACPKLAESNRLDPGIGTMLYLGDCYERGGQTASAWGQFREAAQVAARQGDKREKVARERASKLEPLLSKLMVTVAPSSVVDGLEVRRDGTVINKALYGTEIPVDPGTHVVTATAPKRRAWESKVQVPPTPGVVTVTVPILDEDKGLPPPVALGPAPGPAKGPAGPEPAPVAGTNAGLPPEVAPPPPASPSGAGSTQRIIGLSVAGAGIVGAAVGVVLGMGAKSSYDEQESLGNCQGTRCNQAGLTAREDASGQATLGTIVMGVGLAAVVGGGVLFFTAPKGPKTEAGMTVGVEPVLGSRDQGLRLVGRF